MMFTIEDYLEMMEPAIQRWHTKHIEGFDKAKGSSHNHQAWEGGYRDHLTHCFNLADKLYSTMTSMYGKLPFTLESAWKVLYFHDVGKLFEYGYGWGNFYQPGYLRHDINEEFAITFTDAEMNALTYIHGEGEEYRKDMRVMNELAGFCHAIDVLSARVLHDKKETHDDTMTFVISPRGD